MREQLDKYQNEIRAVAAGNIKDNETEFFFLTIFFLCILILNLNLRENFSYAFDSTVYNLPKSYKFIFFIRHLWFNRKIVSCAFLCYWNLLRQSPKTRDKDELLFRSKWESFSGDENFWNWILLSSFNKLNVFLWLDFFDYFDSSSICSTFF